MDIIEKIARDRVLEDIVFQVGRMENPDNLNDLIQDIYVEDILPKRQKIETLYNKGQLNFYLSRVVCNNINSKTSRYHYRYRKQKMEEYEDKQTDIQEGIWD